MLIGQELGIKTSLLEMHGLSMGKGGETVGVPEGKQAVFTRRACDVQI